MRDPRTPITNRHKDLEAESQAAGQRAAVAHERLRGERAQVAYPRQAGIAGDGPSETGREVFAELVRYRDAIHFNRPDAIHPDKRGQYERDLTARIIEAIQRGGLVFSPNDDGWSATLIDPSKRAEADAADEEARAARRAAADFLAENAAAMGEESERATQQDFAAAIRDGDVQSVRGILGLTDEAKERRSAALTTNDLPN